MTVTMSSEGDSIKSVSSEANDKSGIDLNTDTSQESQDAIDAKLGKSVKPPTENNVEKADKDSKDDVKSEDESCKSKDKLSDAEEKPEPDLTDTEDNIHTEDSNKGKSDGKFKEKKTKKKVESEEKSEDNSEKEDEESDKEKEVPLLDQPLEKSGKRERKNVQRFNEEFGSEHKETGKVEFIEGSGLTLGDIPRVNASISRFKNDDLKILHRLLFKTVGKTTVVKKNIKRFNGFDFKKDSEEYTKKLASAHKMEIKQLKSVCEMLDLLKSGTKDELVTRIVEFLLEPKDSGKPVDGGRPKRSAAVKANNRGYSSLDDYSSDDKHTSRARRDKGKRSNLKDDSSSDEEFNPNQSDGSDDKQKNKRKRKSQKKKSSDDEDLSDGSVGGASSDESDDEPKSKRRKTPKINNKTKSKTTPGKRGRPSASAKNTPSRNAKKSKSQSSDDESDHKDDGSSSEDEPLVKKAKSSEPPTDEEIKIFIKNILEGANLEEITMKTVCQRVYGNYPDFDLTHKKDFIKSTVRSLIST